MRAFLIAAPLLVLAGCNGSMFVSAPTMDQKICAATGAAFAIENMDGSLGDMTASQKATFVATTGQAIAAECGIEFTADAKAMIDAAIMAAALAD